LVNAGPVLGQVLVISRVGFSTKPEIVQVESFAAPVCRWSFECSQRELHPVGAILAQACPRRALRSRRPPRRRLRYLGELAPGFRGDSRGRRRIEGTIAGPRTQRDGFGFKGPTSQ